jgi:hypothetical protein
MPSRTRAWVWSAQRSIRSIDEARAAVQMLLGSWNVRRRKQREPLAILVRRFAGQASGTAGLVPSRVIDLAWLVCRASRGGGHGNCLERSLVLFRALGEAGVRPELWFGMRAGNPRDGHVWVVLDGAPAGDDPAMLRDYVPLMVFGPDGMLTSGSEAAAPPSISWA